jgi:hypothetical protein
MTNSPPARTLGQPTANKPSAAFTCPRIRQNHNAEELTIGSADAAGKHDYPGTADFVHNRTTDECIRIAVFAPVAVKIAVRSIDDRNRPRTRKIYHHAGVIEQSDRVGLREIMQSVEKEMVNLLGPHSQSELIRICDTRGPNHPPRFLNDQVDRMKLPRFRRVVLDLGDYGSIGTASIAAS